jgi:hypothetical protein
MKLLLANLACETSPPLTEANTYLRVKTNEISARQNHKISLPSSTVFIHPLSGAATGMLLSMHDLHYIVFRHQSFKPEKSV